MPQLLEYSSQSQVEQQNYQDHAGGAVFNAAGFGFMPAFMDIHTRETHLSSYRNGEPAVLHILDGLPNYWVAEWGKDGSAVALKLGVIAGFMRGGKFYTLNEIMYNLCDA